MTDWFGMACLAIACTLAIGCGGSESSTSAAVTCSANEKVEGECAGVPSADVCSSDPCTDGVTCASVVSAASDAQLTSALSKAHAGTCVALAPGSYSSASLPGGVSLLGRSAAKVKVAKITLAGGHGATVRGIEIGNGGLDLGSATAVTVDAVSVNASGIDGIHAGQGSSATITHSAIDGAARYGIEAVDAEKIDVENTTISGSIGPGLRAACTGGCSCKSSSTLTVANTSISKSGLVGVSLVGVSATLSGVDVTDNAVGQNFMPSGGISASECTALSATNLHVLDNSSFGVLVDTSSATLGKTGDGNGVEVSRNLIGIWVQKTGATKPQPVELANCVLDSNDGVGIGADEAAHGIIIHDSQVRNTKLKELPAVTSDGTPLGSKSIGDGLNWLGGASIAIDGLELSGNQRESLLIDGPVGAGSSIANVAQSSGDQQQGVVQQDLPPNGNTPNVQGSAPPVKKSSSQKYAVPAAPTVPPSL